MLASRGWLLTLLAGCAGYGAGDLGPRDPLVARATECVELRVTPHHDAEVAKRGWLAVRYELGNHCRAAVPIDLRRARVVRLADGMSMSPRGQGEVRPVLLDGGTRGGEVLAYAASGAADYCVDLSGVAPGAEALEPVCFTYLASIEEAKR